ncbi:hypothetical protein EUGRSUZ_E03928 [Eucalyptus grandis]|uniref:Uncharacterized protein n=2 Tax=Eucalyptus grandis TaxID=71139 RepID=A0ACC3L0Q1_EUCGR|nr:hypothetical protein EUGRSUZ_E03928 [Eucalyptus grandis]
MDQGSEVHNFIEVWLSVFAALGYCYAIGKIARQRRAAARRHPPGRRPLPRPPSRPPLHTPRRQHGLLHRLARKLQAPALRLRPGPPGLRPLHLPPPGHKSAINYGIKILLLATILRIYDYSDRLPQKVVWFLYILHIYICLEIILVAVAVAARATLGFELEPQFDEPYLSTSLQDFWGRRWNIMVTRILRPTVYEPLLAWASRAVGRRYAALPAVLGTFAVSALMHELIFYYLGRVPPNWEITWFFLFHGVCLMVEIAAKKELKLGLRLPRPAAAALTVGFVMLTAFWWFLPPLLRCRADERAFEEYAAVGALVRDVVGRGLSFTLGGAFNASSPAKL